MPIREVLRMGHPVLARKAAPVLAFDTPELHALLRDLEDTMAAENGAGIAAPQIGVSQRVVIFGTGKPNPRYPDADEIPYTVLVNPELHFLGTAVEEGWEGCLSVPGLRGVVPRFTKLRYTGYDAGGRPIDRTVEGWHARVVQHECDHLDGILYPQRMMDFTRFGFTKELFPDEDIADD